MDAEMWLGIAIIACATLVYVGLYVWSARRIDVIASKRLTSLRSIVREFRHGKHS